MNLPKIYVVNKGCHDFSSASEIGTLIYLTEGKYNLLSIGAIYRQMQPILSSSDEEDYILVCGPTVMNIVATSLFISLHSRLNLLIYHIGKDNIGRYKRRHLSLTSTNNKDK